MNAKTTIAHASAEQTATGSDDSAKAGATERWKKIAIAGIGFFVVAMLITGAYWSLQPDPFDVETVAMGRVGGEEPALRPGVVAVSSVGKVARTLLEKPGGYLHNDLTPPGVYLDNMPSWEYGALKEVRDSLGALRNDFSRSQTQSIENIELRKADEFLNYNGDSWMLPSTESEFRQGIEALDRYLDALIAGDDPSARFFTRADNLAAYLSIVEKRLGSYAQRLSASVGDPELTAGFVTGDAGGEAPAPAGFGAGSRATTPWMEIDNVFYEARGYAWALLHMFQALAIEFEPVLRDKNAKVTVQQIIFDLEQATKRMWSPMVLNGHGFGYVANHSLVLGSYISRANAAVLDLRILLQQG